MHVLIDVALVGRGDHQMFVGHRHFDDPIPEVQFLLSIVQNVPDVNRLLVCYHHFKVLPLQTPMTIHCIKNVHIIFDIIDCPCFYMSCGVKMFFCRLVLVYWYLFISYISINISYFIIISSIYYHFYNQSYNHI